MAQVKYSEANYGGSNSKQYSKSHVGFFSLKDDGDEAIVRILCDSTDDFNIMTTHPITLDGKFKKVNCLRDPREPLDKCPLCKAGEKVQQRIFINLIQYTMDASGNIVAEAKVWDRPFSYAMTLKSLLDEYGPLTNNIFKVKRCGAAGSRETTYNIMFGSPNVYKPESYPVKPELFDGFNVLGPVVMNKTFDELNTFVTTGVLPAKVGTSNQEVQEEPALTQPTEQRQTSWNTNNNTNGGVNRPTRYYA